MYQSSDTGPKIIIIAMAMLFGFLFLIFLYYIWAEKFDYDNVKNPKPLTPTDIQNIRKVTGNIDMGLDNHQLPATPNVGIPTTDNSLPLDPSDPEYVPPGFKKKLNGKPKKQVFNVTNNIYTYNEAEAVCKAFGAELATYPQLVNAYRKGADWCNYGWTKGQLALYPTQKESWLKLQEDDETKDNCGKVGINGGYFENPDMLFGVNCYGIKPPPKNHEKVKTNTKSKKEYELEQQIARIKKNLSNVSINPFNMDKWSNC
jgi:hypothetical protein